MKRTLVTGQLFLILSYAGIHQCYSQCLTAGPVNGTTFSDLPLIGAVTWNNPNNGGSSNNAYSSASGFANGQNSHYYVVTGFNFSIPSNAIICGVEFDVERSCSSFLGQVRDNSVRLVNNGVLTGLDHFQTGNWPFTDTYTSYGGMGDNWNVILTPADINAGNFGFAISVNLGSSTPLFLTARIDHVYATIYYDLPLPIEDLNFNAVAENSEPVIYCSWKTTSMNVNYFTVYKSADGLNWQQTGTIQRNTEHNTTKEYYFKDLDPTEGLSYYRLKQTNADGTENYSEIVPVSMEKKNINLYPNPVTDHLNISSPVNIKFINIYTPYGDIKYTFDFSQEHAEKTNVDLSSLDPGVYILNVVTDFGNENFYIIKN